MLCVFTQWRLSPCQILQHGVEGTNEEVMSELHHRQPKQMPQKEPGQKTLTETLLCERQREEIYDTWLLNSVVSYNVLIHATVNCTSLQLQPYTPCFTGTSVLTCLSSLVSCLSLCSELRVSDLPQVILTKVKGHSGSATDEFFDSYLLYKLGFQSRIFPRDDDNEKINCLLLLKKTTTTLFPFQYLQLNFPSTRLLGWLNVSFFLFFYGFSLRNMQKWFFKRSILFYLFLFLCPVTP